MMDGQNLKKMKFILGWGSLCFGILLGTSCHNSKDHAIDPLEASQEESVRAQKAYLDCRVRLKTEFDGSRECYQARRGSLNRREESLIQQEIRRKCGEVSTDQIQSLQDYQRGPFKSVPSAPGSSGRSRAVVQKRTETDIRGNYFTIFLPSNFSKEQISQLTHAYQSLHACDGEADVPNHNGGDDDE